MIAYLNGIVADVTKDNLVLDVNDIGYNVKISTNTAGRLPGTGKRVKLFIYTCVREDAFWLYGFLSKSELEIFKKCITVNGIGPKAALSILSVMDADEFRFAIISGDVKTIKKAPGIGNKMAERLILDLKDKITIDADMINGELADTESDHITMDTQQKKEAMEALVSLGYSQSEAMKAVSAIEGIEHLDSGAVLKEALKKMF